MLWGCVICQDLFDAAVGTISTKCGHVFHSNCIEKWLEQSSTCPECRRKLKKESITKLFFNFSLENTSGNSDQSLDTLKEHLLAKDRENAEKNEKIKELQSRFASVERENLKMHQDKLELERKLHLLRQTIKSFNGIEEKNQKLIAENNILQNDLEHLNNVKTIVEGCCNDAKKILTDMHVQVCCEDGKAATHRIATYCSVIKRELACSVEEKSQLQNELTRMKRRIGILQADSAKKIAHLQQQVKRYEDINSSVRIASPSDAHGNRPSQCNDHAKSDHGEYSKGKNQITPITIDNPENKKQKLNIVVVDREVAKVSTQVPQTPVLRLTKSVFPKRRIEGNDSVLRIGYNGLGGHGRMVTGSAFKKVRPSK